MALLVRFHKREQDLNQSASIFSVCGLGILLLHLPADHSKHSKKCEVGKSKSFSKCLFFAAELVLLGQCTYIGDNSAAEQ